MMKSILIDAREWGLGFDAAKSLADEFADNLLGSPMLLSWYDRDRDLEAPSHVSECHDACEIPGYLDYAESRDGELRIDIDQGRFVFCYRGLGEFAEVA